MNWISWTLIIMAVLLAALAIYLFAYKRPGTTWKSRGTLLIAAIAVGLLGWSVRTSQVFGSHNRLTKWLLSYFYGSSAFSNIEAEWQYEQVQAEVLGRYVATKRAGKRYVILRAELLKNSDGEPSANPLVDGFKAGVGSSLELVTEIEVPMTPVEEKPADGQKQEAVPPMGEKPSAWTSEKLTEMLSEVTDYDILVSCLPLPEGFALPNKELVLASGYGSWTDAAIRKGTVLAAVTYKEDADYGVKPCPEELQKAFDKRYRLVTAETFEEKKDHDTVIKE